jgi:hypothetical protein
MTYAPLGGPKTAKRQIQIRRFMTEQQKIIQSHSDPFLPNSDPEDTLNPPVAELSFKAAYVPEHELQPGDGILSSKVNLDEADRFIAALRLPKRMQSGQQLPKLRLFTYVDLEKFRVESNKLDRMRFAEAEDPPEDGAV